MLRQLRDLCQDNAQHLEQLVISDLEAREGNDAERLEEAKRRNFDQFLGHRYQMDQMLCVCIYVHTDTLYACI